ncbi:MAG: penicillin-binding protein 2 [Oceanibaculum nanhaiense]|uniref:penicillin-binding protein 2 n=1 Tax=Oceanibaculum nanhaiense TaxID=1909734 RepID=UPI0025A4A090|nr:penicillin-binding protein 2 [Oceanibaculum nanhaiense]MDM7945218.1 penicillin-binding protein 2 [Oceanibaculum nanhaiense]
MKKNRDQERQKVLTRRALMLGAGQLGLVGALAGRLYYLQVVQADRYRVLADDNRISIRLLPPPRGEIVDRLGVPLAINEKNYRVVIVREQSGNVPVTLERLGRIIDLPEREVRRVLRDMRRKRAFVPITVRENLSWEEVSRVEVSAPDLPGISIEVGLTRFYPYAEQAAHVLGYVAAVSESELTGDPLLELPDFRIGKNGIEKVHDQHLRGKAGTSQVEVNALGRVIRELSREEGQPGRRIEITLDMELQRFAMNRLGEESAAAVIMDVHNGDVLALASTPGFNPNAFNRGLTPNEWEELISNERGPLTNKAIAGQYAPGSTFKMVVALAALETGVISPGQRVFCPGHLELGDTRFHCWKRPGHGHMDMHDAIKHSCDVYFYEVSKRLGIARIAAMAERLGLGQTLGFDLPGERPGLIPTREWKQARMGKPWHQGETLIAGIGQGYILTTPLQLAVMTARLVNGGIAVTPHLTRHLPGQGGLQTVALPGALPGSEGGFPSLGIAQEHLRLVRTAMAAVTNDPNGGTAYRARIAEAGMEMGGKTGTAQVRRITMAERLTGVRKNEDLPWRHRDHALFVGYAPVNAPRYCCAVIVEHGGGGSAVAAPIARDLLIETQRRDPAQGRPLAFVPPGRS